MESKGGIAKFQEMSKDWENNPKILRKIIENLSEKIDELQAKATNSISENDIQIVFDGNAWCAYRLPFRNLQEDDAGFGATPQIALTALLKLELPDGCEERMNQEETFDYNLEQLGLK